MKKTKAIEGFDILKLIFIPPQILYHYQETFALRLNGFNFYGGRYDPNVIIELMFIISGFLTLYTASEKDIGLRSFGAKLLRFYPMALLSTAAALIIKSIGAEDISALWNLRTLLSNFLLFFVGWPGFYSFGYNHPCWYLCVLIQGYIVFHLLLWLRKHIRVDWLLLSVAMVCAAYGLNRLSLLQYHSYRGIQAFFIGVGLCRLQQIIPEKKKTAIFIAILSALLLALFPFLRGKLETFVFYPALIMLSVWYRGSFSEKNARLFSTLGAISFDLYLWHSPVIHSISMISRVTGYQFSHSLGSMLLFAVFCIILSCFIYRYVDRPISRWTRKLIKGKALVS